MPLIIADIDRQWLDGTIESNQGYEKMSKNSPTIWVVVLVQSGIPALVEAYLTESEAAIREKSLRNAMRLDYDEAGVFEVDIGVESIQ